MKLIVGLGNPGSQYKDNRHNVGFGVIDALTRRWEIELSRRKHHARYGSGTHGAEQVILLKPQTYMNNSGSSVAEAVNFYKTAPTDLLVVSDDMALELGQLRLRRQGSAGGHNGLKDIIEKLGCDDFARLRIGIGPASFDAVGHVLGAFSPQEKDVVGSAIEKAARAVECWLNEGIDQAMNEYNVKS